MTTSVSRRFNIFCTKLRIRAFFITPSILLTHIYMTAHTFTWPHTHLHDHSLSLLGAETWWCLMGPVKWCAVAWLAEKQHIPVRVFDLTRPRLEPTIYYTRDEHANHYNNDSVYNCRAINLLINILHEWINNVPKKNLCNSWCLTNIWIYSTSLKRRFTMTWKMPVLKLLISHQRPKKYTN
jgi:hypothetical protein